MNNILNNIKTNVEYHLSNLILNDISKNNSPDSTSNNTPNSNKIPGITNENTAPTMPSGFEHVSLILGWVRWGALIVCVAALIAFFGHLAMERQNGGGQNGSMGWLAKILVAIIGISGAITIIGLLVP